MMNTNHPTHLEIIIEEMKSVYLHDERPWIIGYSGGKDSSVVAQLTYKMLQELPAEKRHKKIYVVSSDTMIENPIILAYLKKSLSLINENAKSNQLPIEAHLVYPNIDDTFWVNMIGKGYPPPKSMQFRWCTERLKIKPSNAFIYSQLEESDVVVLLGVRKAESVARRTRIENRAIDGYLLTPHTTLKSRESQAYVYNPIVDLTTDDVWEILLNQFKGTSPWNSDNNALFALYAQGSGEGECPFITTDNKKSNTCGNSRFGCWVCTVVQEDKSLNGFIESGEEWLIPLAEFRSWLINPENRNSLEYRKTHKRSGAVHTKNGERMLGPFNLKGKKMILQKLLKAELEIKEHDPDLDLITVDELKKIDEIWDAEEDLSRRELVETYYETTGVRLPWDDYKEPLFDQHTIEIIKGEAQNLGVEIELVNNLLILIDENKHYSNQTHVKKKVDRLMRQTWVHYDEIERKTADLREEKDSYDEN